MIVRTGNWIASYKDGNLIAEAIPHGGGLKFPVSKGREVGLKAGLFQ